MVSGSSVEDLGTGSPPRWTLWRIFRSLVLVLGSILALGVTAGVSVAAGASLKWVAINVGVCVAGMVLIWLFWLLLRRLLWRVGRRLAFTYFLVGVLPIPMVLFLLITAAYLMGGFFLGHQFRQAVRSVHHDLALAAEVSLEAGVMGSSNLLTDVARAYYRDGERVGGDLRAPEKWPDWLEQGELEASYPLGGEHRLPPLIGLDDGSYSLASARRHGEMGVVTFYDGHLETRLREISGTWIELIRFTDERSEGLMDVSIMGERFVLQPMARAPSETDRRDFISRGGTDPGIMIQGFDVFGEIVAFDNGEILGERMSANLAGTTTYILDNLFSNSREVDTLAWVVFMVPAFLLFDVFLIAWLMAVLMTLGISGAVNRLSRATTALHAGDFGSRIPIRRRDQIGELQASFNRMAEGLEQSVESAAQQEIIEKELAIARDVQKSLIPKDIVQGGSVEFATFFEPSAAIGGDYFDILRLDRSRIAVVIADVSGHGLSAGLRMAMLKSALMILVEEHDDPEEILRRLDRVVRSGREGPSFVTATLALLDTETGQLNLTNAGHPPTYVVHNEEVQEIVLPGAPLGALGHTYGTTRVTLRPGDAVVWLSDGFIEATNPAGELFGYERTAACIAGEAATASQVRDRLLDNVKRYTAGQPAEDDRTMVVMRYLEASSIELQSAAS